MKCEINCVCMRALCVGGMRVGVWVCVGGCTGGCMGVYVCMYGCASKASGPVIHHCNCKRKPVKVM